jgi:non-specific serine/threonine protein kinase
MRVCPLCSRRYDDTGRFCPHDGTQLRPVDPLVGAVLDGKYRVDALLGSGAMGAVYRATQLNLSRTVAVKVVRGHIVDDAVVLERFKREALTIARLRHPHIVAIYDFGVAHGAGAYIVMEYLEGCSLRQEIQRRGRMPGPYAAEVVRQACSALHAAHAAGVVHRDIKPDNIFLTAASDGGVDVKVLDFGVAKLEGGAETAERALTMSGAIVGTPVYMSPEACENLACDARSDVYSLGCVLYEMVTGRPPFIANSIPQLLLAHVAHAPEPPGRFAPGLAPELEAAILRALAKRPADRFQTAAELRRAVAPDAATSSPQIPNARVADTIPDGNWSVPSTEVIAVSTGEPDLARDTAALPPTNIPQQLTSFVGRAAEVAEVMSLVPTARLLTLTGPGGIGKTRLALQAAAELRESFRDGVWVVELAALADQAFVEQAVAAALGVREEPGRMPLASLAAHLQDREVLLALDNCEHLRESCAALAGALLRACPGLRLLASSQVPLGALGELVYRVSPLTLPDAGDRTVEALLERDAVRLFVDRAKLARPGFALTSANAQVVASLCRKLDGIPLAIELAAARVKVLSLEQILMRLDDRFRLLTGGDRAALPRQQTLRATLDWSHSLLSPAEQALLRRLSVFAGGCTLDAAEQVASCELREEVASCELRVASPEGNPDSDLTTYTSRSAQLATDEVLDGLASLVDRSFVSVEEQAGAVRYRMLETVRQYGVEKLKEEKEDRGARAAHLDWCLRISGAATWDQWRPDERERLSMLEAEHDNLRAALRWSLGPGGDAEAGLRLCCALGRFWETRGYWSEGRQWLETALAACAGGETQWRARALHWAGWLAYCQGDLQQAIAPLERCLALRRELGDTERVALTLIDLGNIVEDQGDFDQAEALYGEALGLCREIDLQFGVARALSGIGLAALSRCEYERSEALYAEALEMVRRVDHKPGIRVVLHQLGEIAMRRGDLDRATRLLDESMENATDAADTRLTAHSLHVMSAVARGRGENEEALSLAGRALEMFREIGDKRGVAYALESFACTAAARGQAERALTLFGAAEAIRETIQLTLTPADREALAQFLGAARRAAGEGGAERAIAAGRAMGPDRAAAYALEDLAGPAGG